MAIPTIRGCRVGWPGRLGRVAAHCSFLLLLTITHVNAAPSYPLEGLLPRAETVYIARLAQRDTTTVSLSSIEHLRGARIDQATLTFIGAHAATTLEPNSRYYVISQGDSRHGKPEPVVSLGQHLRGQAGYRGWLMFPVKTDGKETYLEHIGLGAAQVRVSLDTARRLVLQIPYNPEVYGKAAALPTATAAPAPSPNDATFTLQLKDGRRRFHMGEIIPLQMIFRSHLPGITALQTAREHFRWSGSGPGPIVRPPTETWSVEPREGVVDALRDYQPFAGFSYSSVRVTSEPSLVEVELNDWLRFDRPGVYRVSVATTRVLGLPVGPVRRVRPPLVSNTIEFEILPSDAKWENQALQRVRKILNGGGNHDEQLAAMRQLRFLGTKEAAREVLDRYLVVQRSYNTISYSHRASGRLTRAEWEANHRHNEDMRRQLLLGLYGSRHRDFILQEMHRAMAAPAQPISSHFLSLLSDLETKLRYPEPPPYESTPGNSDYKEYEAAEQQHRNAVNRVQREHWQELLAAAPRKIGQAQIEAFQALTQKAPTRIEERLRPDWIEPIRQFRTLTAELFSRLGVSVQWDVLLHHWPIIKSPAMIPVLQRIVAQPADENIPLRTNIPSFQAKSLHSQALLALYDLAPELARPIILQEISQPRFDSDIVVLGRLPEATLPELDNTLVENLARSLAAQRGATQASPANNYQVELHSRLVERYASGAISAQVRQVYDRLGEDAAVELRATLLAYLWRTDVPAAMVLTAAQMATREQVSASENSTGRQLLDTIAALHMTPELEKLAISLLKGGDTRAEIEAISVLSRFGSSAAEAPLWKRLEAFRTQWKDRAEELNANTAETRGPRGVEMSLVNALRQGPGWNSFKAGLERLRDLAVSNAARAAVESEMRQSSSIHLDYLEPEPIGVAKPQRPPELHWRLLWYSGDSLESLKAKLAQFAPGTMISRGRWEINTRNRNADEARLSAEIAAFAKEKNLHFTG